MRARSGATLGAACAFMLAATPAPADSLQAGGLIFSDELGGLELVSVSGSGTADDPIRVEEVLRGTGPAYLVIRRVGLAAGTGEQADAYPSLGQVIMKVVHNASARVWSGFDVELRQDIGRPSSYTDGLSFDQPSGLKAEARSDRFGKVRHVDEPFDMLDFYDGHVDPGGRVAMVFKITDPTPTPVLYMVQQPQILMVWRGGPRLAQSGRVR
jgi:hypothetical protein